MHPSFVSINADSVNGSFPDFVLPVNGGEAAFTPMSESGNADTTNAVVYSSANGNIFYGTNVYANYITKHHPFVPFLNIYNFVNEANLPLPAGISNVRAFQKQNSIQVEWSNSTENNVSHYEIERSATAAGFVKTARVNAKGGVSNNYAWLDVVPAAGNNYYRIKIVNKDGSFTYSPVVNVRIGGKTDITVYPNPVKDNNFNIQFTSVEKGKYRINVYNQAGQLMTTSAYEHQGGSATCNMALKKGMPGGVYVVLITNGADGITRSLLVE